MSALITILELTNRESVTSLISRKLMIMFLESSLWLFLRRWASQASRGVGFSFTSPLSDSHLINGEASGCISISRGLRQGDPLSPLLFILVMETLSKLVKKACEKGLLEGFYVGNSQSHGLLVFHLFVEETLIFCGPCESDLGYLRCILLLF